MNVSLSPQQEGFVKEKLTTGHYHSANEVIREALHLLEERDALLETKRKALIQQLEPAIQSLKEGKGRPFDKEAIKARGRAQLG